MPGIRPKVQARQLRRHHRGTALRALHKSHSATDTDSTIKLRGRGEHAQLWVSQRRAHPARITTCCTLVDYDGTSDDTVTSE